MWWAKTQQKLVKTMMMTLFCTFELWYPVLGAPLTLYTQGMASQKKLDGPEDVSNTTLLFTTLYNLLSRGLSTTPVPPPQIALNDSKSSLGDVFQLSLPKYAKQTIFTSNHVSWGVRYTPWTRSLCQKVFWRRSSAATGTFLMKWRSKSQNFSFWKERNFAILSVISSKKCP